MANQEQLKILKQGVKVWNEWKGKNYKSPNKIVADLSGANLADANLRGADLNGANLSSADLTGANLISAQLLGAYLGRANLSYAKLRYALLHSSDCFGTNFSGANLFNANLIAVNFLDAKLTKADFNKAWLGYTILGNVDLREVQHLETVVHWAPSTIGMDTLFRSEGKIPEIFLRGCGVPDQMIEYIGSLVGKPIEYYSCFISYSSKDQEIAQRIHNDLQSKGVRCWFAPEDLKIGDKFRIRIDESIRLHDKLLLILSKHSVSSDWVEKEVETAMERERKDKRTVLFPIRLDESVMEIESGWPADIRRMREIGNFTDWKNHDSYQKAFERLLKDLKAEPTIK
ncbi:MAG: toll/interleukin-1 receptor domain-containing protein [Ignavibacteriae bacterium]|nr:toll/interleukin-1 receptor domain-containing protein [Ignavibacteria bacterium]MBI3365320.1 toll/interleukin-1 receptor domain-containing protein [Ignavibacteriota bacterium]